MVLGSPLVWCQESQTRPLPGSPGRVTGPVDVLGSLVMCTTPLPGTHLSTLVRDTLESGGGQKGVRSQRSRFFLLIN